MASHTNKIIAIITKGIHIGLSTHHQLQLITPHNLRTIKATNKSPPVEIPADCPLEFAIVLFLMYMFTNFTNPHLFIMMIQAKGYPTSPLMVSEEAENLTKH